MLRLSGNINKVLRFHSKKNTTKTELIKDINNLLKNTNKYKRPKYFSHSKIIKHDLKGHVDRY